MAEFPLRLGIVGTGRIAQKFTEELRHVPEMSLVAVFNPRLPSARRFAEGTCACFERLAVFTSFEMMLAEVDAVYIASPSETHFTYALQALEAGVHVLCEKPLAFSSDEISCLYAVAQKQGLVFLHAVKTAFFPAFRLLEKMVREGVVGDVVDVEASFTKLMDGGVPELADDGTGGSMRWLSTYPLYAISRFAGTQLDDARFFSVLDSRNVEVFTRALLILPGVSASFKVGFGAKTDGSLVITGTQGFVRVPAPWWNTVRFEVGGEDPNDTRVCELLVEGSGLRYEITAFAKMIRDGAIRSEFITEADDLFFSEVYRRFVEAR